MQAVDKAVKELLSVLMDLSFLSEYYLAGGTNLALRYNHRTSIDLDFFAHRKMEQESSNHVGLKLREIFGDRFESNNITKVGVFGFIDKIKVDFVNYPYPLLQHIDLVEGARLAHPLDIGGMKINAIVGRGSRKDFFDLHYLLKVYPLTEIMDNYQKKYGLDNIQQAKMSLSYFVNAEDTGQSDNKFTSFTDTSWKKVKADIIDSLSNFDSARIVSLATKFHMDNEYPGKTSNISAYYPNGALSNAFYEAYGIVLTERQLDEIEIAVKP